ncbi:MAG: alkaline phosphatase family protein [Chloroflexota bacterium]|nr:alkaline phosphatase family protein [Chloroflexota bacterium]
MPASAPVGRTTGEPTSSQTGAPISGPCTGAAAPALYEHVIVFWLQNQPPTAVYGLSTAPYLNYLASSCGTATKFHWVWHASFPPITSGEGKTLARSCQTPALSGCMLSSESIFSQVRGSGGAWRAYVEDMPANCSSIATRLYSPIHNPGLYYSRIASDCGSWDVPLGTTEAGTFLNDIRTEALPEYAVVVPNLCHDSHDCPLDVADSWLKTWISRILSSKTYGQGGTAIFITWDDSGVDPPGVEDCTLSDVPECLVPFFVISPSVRPGTIVSDRLTMYSLLRTTEELLGITTFLGAAANAPSLRPLFRL